MMNEQIFSLYRFKHLIIKTIKQHQKMFLMMMGIIGALESFPTLLTMRSEVADFSSNGSMISFIFAAIVGGYLLTASSFKEAHNPQTNILYLTLPVSAAERFWTNWLVTGPLYIIAANIAVLLVTGLNALACSLIWDAEVTMFHPLTESNLWDTAKYMIFHALFYWGAVFFKSKHFVKTLGTFILSGFLISLTTIVILGSATGKVAVTEVPDFLNPENFKVAASSTLSVIAIIFLFFTFRLIKRKQA